MNQCEVRNMKSWTNTNGENRMTNEARMSECPKQPWLLLGFLASGIESTFKFLHSSFSCFVPAALFMLSATLASCTVGPDYKRPSLDVPSGYKSASQPSASARLGQYWWTLFDDPVLNDLEVAAVAGNQNLKAAVARVAQARAAMQGVASQFYPTIMLTPSYQKSRTSGNGLAGQSVRTGNYQIPFDLSYEIDVWGRVRRSYEAAQAQMEATVIDVDVVRLTLTADVAANYFTLRSLDAQAEILARNVQTFRDHLALTQKQFSTGMVSRIDVVQAQAQLDVTLTAEIEVHRQRADVEHALATLLGRAPVELSLARRPLNLAPPAIPAGLPSELLRRRPDVAQAEQILAATNAQIGVAQANFYPTFSLTGVAGYESINLRHAVDWQSRIWSIGPSISAPIFEGGRLTANLEQARARYEEVQANYRQTVLNAYAEVEDALTDLHMRADSATAQERAVVASREYLQLAEVQYKKGLTNYLLVVDASRTLLTNEVAAEQIRNQRMISAVLLIKALGGGWESNHSAATQPAPASVQAASMPAK